MTLTSQRKRVCVLGSTGSIGVSTLDVLERHRSRYELVAISGHRQEDPRLAQ